MKRKNKRVFDHNRKSIQSHCVRIHKFRQPRYQTRVQHNLRGYELHKCYKYAREQCWSEKCKQAGTAGIPNVLTRLATARMVFISSKSHLGSALRPLRPNWHFPTQAGRPTYSLVLRSWTLMRTAPASPGASLMGLTNPVILQPIWTRWVKTLYTIRRYPRGISVSLCTIFTGSCVDLTAVSPGYERKKNTRGICPAALHAKSDSPVHTSFTPSFQPSTASWSFLRRCGDLQTE
eukprot:g19637.t1